MSRPGMGTQEKRLHDAILTAVRNGFTGVVERAAEKMTAFEEKYSSPTQGKLLDFCDSTEKQRYSPLMYACESNSLEMVRLLLKNNASVGFVNQGGVNALHVACKNGHLDVVKALLQAAESQKKFCQRKGLPSDLHIALNARTSNDGWYPLLYAVRGGHVEVVKCLLEKEKEFTENHTKSVRTCIQVTNKKKQNVLHIAAHHGRLDCLKELHPHIPSTIPETDSLYLATDKKGWNVLHFACAGGNVEVLEQLLAVSVLKTAEFLNGKSKRGYTPLLTACEYQRIDIVRHLAKIAEVNFAACCADQDSDTDEEGRQGGMMGLHLAAIHDSPEIASLLIEKGCPIDALDEEGETALHIAIRKTSLDVADVLRRAPGGEELEQIRNKGGQTPSDIKPEEVIPPEIKKRGKEAEESYRKALRKGKKKILRCNLLVLGEQRVGKTSLIRLLMGKEFILELDQTHGIDNQVVDTVDVMPISTTKWEEVKQEDQAKENNDLLVNGVVEEMGQLLPHSDKQGEKQAVKYIPEERLLRTLDVIFLEMERMQESHIPAPKVWTAREQPSSPLPVSTLAVRHSFIPADKLVSNEVPRRATFLASQPPRPPPIASLKKEDKLKVNPHAPVADKATKPHLEPAAKQKTKVDSSEQRETPKQVGNHRIAGISRRQIQSINRELKSISRQKKEPTLHLNTYDFAGQKEYRPMHHCFITRRSIYLVVFNLQELVKLIPGGQVEGSNKALEEIRYWLNSIHAHIHSGPKEKRVFLVGTHMSPKNPKQGKPITEEKLQQIHGLLEDTFYSRSGDPHKRFANHLQFPGLNKRIFAAIENSFDGSNERDNSGAKALQQKLMQTSMSLEFLKEKFPILWLRFEALLIRLREARQQREASQVVKLADVRNLAKQCGIDQDDIDHALLFFHDTGTIICLKELPTLFLEEWEQQQLANLVLLDPKWLITLMRIVMELEDGANDYTGEDLRDLKETGIARAVLLRDCWKEYHSTDNDVSFRQLCLMLQAYCLIYPVRGDVGRCFPHPTQSDNHKISTTTAAASHNLSHSQSVCGADTTADNFLVPCKLPQKDRMKKDHLPNLPWITFYFDFQGFLPVEVFNRFVCLMLARSQAKCTTSRLPEFSATCCRFYEIEGCNWKLEIEAGHLLKVSVIPIQKEKPPSLHILMVHYEFLQKICEKSDLKGLVYHGGPKVVCECKWSGILHCVDYPDDHDIVCNPKCPMCFKPHNTDKLLSPQVQKEDKQGSHQLPTAESEGAAKVIHHTINVHTPQAIIPTAGSTVVTQGPVPTGRAVLGMPQYGAQSQSPVATKSRQDLQLESSPAVNSSVPSPLGVTTQSSHNVCSPSGPQVITEPSMAQLMRIKTSKGDKVEIIKTIAPDWKQVGYLMDLDPKGQNVRHIEAEHAHKLNGPVICCQEMFRLWLDSPHATWENLIELLIDSEHKELAEQVKNALGW